MDHPTLPRPRGPISAAVLDALVGDDAVTAVVEHAESADPYGDDVQLSLYVLYELHYRGFAGVDPDLEWDPALLTVRSALERRFLDALLADVEPGATREDVERVVASLLVEPARPTGPSVHLADAGQMWQMQDYVALRSLYHLKEADPQAWVIPRLEGRAKASLVTVEHDEFGAGRADHAHARLFAEMMDELGLDSRYGAYLDVAPAAVLATVNVMSLWGLHRRWRGALVGQFALVEITSPPGAARLSAAMARLGVDERGRRFYDEHVEADAVHEQLVRHDLLEGLLDDAPELASDVVFGLRAATFLDDRLDDQLLASWSEGRSVLVPPDGSPEGRERRRWLVSQNG